MAKISFAPSPWASVGGLAGGLATGLGQGMDIAARRETNEQLKQQRQMQAALQLLGLGVKAEDPQMVEAINAMLGKVAPGMQIPVVSPEAQVGREMQRLTLEQQGKAKMAEGMGFQPGSPEYEKLVFGQVLREKKDMVPWQRQDGSTIMIPADKAAQLEQMEIIKQMGIAAKGAGGGRGGGDPAKGMIPWMDPQTGAFLGYAPKLNPPKPGAVPGTASGFRPPTETPFSPDFQAKVLAAQRNVQKAIEGGRAPTPEDVDTLRIAGGVNAVGPSGFPQPPSMTKKKGRGGVAQPVAQAQGGTDEEPPE